MRVVEIIFSRKEHNQGYQISLENIYAQIKLYSQA